MKLTKIFAFAVAVLAMTSCADNKVEDYPNFLGSVNTEAGVTVSLPSTFTFQENTSSVEVPITVTGKTNGKVVVTVAVKSPSTLPADTELAKEVEHFNVTSYTVNIPEGESEGSIEIVPVWEQGVVNDDRVFDLTITSVQGATATQKDCLVTIENADDVYTQMCGVWQVQGYSLFSNGEDLPATLTITTPDPVAEADEYGSVLYATGVLGYNEIYIPLGFEFDNDTQEMHISILSGFPSASVLFNFTGLGSCLLVSQTAYSTQGFGPDIEAVTATTNEITFDPEDEFFLTVMPYPALNTIAGFFDGWDNIKFTR